MTDHENISLEERDLRYAERLAEMIRCRTVSKKDGFEAEEFLKLRQVIETLFPRMTEAAERTILGKDAYLYKLKGRDESRNVMVMSHHDVVEAKGTWQEKAFGGTIRDGKLWGRGTVDTKTPLFAEFTAIEELLEEGFVFPVNVYLFSSHNEETGGDGALLAFDYFNEKKICFDWIIDEGGAVIEPPMAGIDRKCAMMAVHEKGRCTAQLSAKNLPGHAGLAGGHKTPVMRMAEFMAEVDEKKPFIRKLHPEVRGMFEAMAPHMSFPMGFVFSHLNLFSGLLIKMMPKLNAAAGEMLGTGCTFRRLSTDEEGNCVGEAFLRCINDADFAKDLATLRTLAAKHAVEITVRDEDNEYYRPASLESGGYRYIKKTVEESFPYAAAVPFILPAGTDARHFSNLSDAVIRFAPIDIDKQQYASVHGENENISVDKLHLAVDFYKRLLKNIGTR